MKKIALFFCLSITICSCSSLNTKYFDDNYNEISKSKFKKLHSSRLYILIPGNEANHKRLIPRKETGKINRADSLDRILEEELNLEIDSNKPIVIVHFGNAQCSNSSSYFISDFQLKFNAFNFIRKFDEVVYETTQVKPIYFYKNKSCLEKYKDFTSMNQDPDLLLEKLFLKYGTPYMSYIMISTKGNYSVQIAELSEGTLREELLEIAND
jgi:hypothetical protein